MNSLLGQGFVLLALLICAFGIPVGFVAGKRRSMKGLALTRRLAIAFAAATVAANVVMWIALVSHDFSVSYVAQVGSIETPLHITIVSLWSSLEGSILFWAMVLGLFVLGLATLQREGHEDYLAYSLATTFCVGLFFCFMIAGPANPFAATPPPIPTNGPGPNPLLQNHVLMIVHPPMLYLGYVGMTIPFAMAVAALLRGQLGPTWLRPLRNWLIVPTAFLTLGIMLGGWWSYEVLGWGGYWAWDPVENASFLPWLTAVAALHSAIVQQRRGTLKAWTVILIMVSFLLTILGTFLTRSGVVNSVHSFTQSPIGPLFLGFLGVLLIAVVALLALRIDTLAPEPARQSLASRETGFLINNLLLVVVMFTVLVGTLYPILAEWLRGVKVSVGEPYFNRMSVPMLLGLLMLIGIGPALPWGRASASSIRRALLWPLPAAAAGLAISWLLGGRSFPVMLTCALAGYALWVNLDQGLRPTRARMRHGESPAKAAINSTRLVPRRAGAYLSHIGVITVAVAIAVSSNYQIDSEATLAPGQSALVGGYELTFGGSDVVEDPHVARQRANIEVSRKGKRLGVLRPSLNYYETRREPIGTPAVHSTAGHDLYLTLMSVDSQGAIGLRAIITPGVMWIWIGVLLMALGTMLCLVPPASALHVTRSAPATSEGQDRVTAT